MSNDIKIVNMVVLVSLEDGSVKELFMTKKDKLMWIKTLQDYYLPGKLKAVDSDLSQTIKIE